MELTISKRNFLRGLTRTHGVADRKSSMPILSNILLTTEGADTLRFAATDLFIGVTATAEAQVSAGGSVAVAAKTLFDIVKNLPDGEVKLSVGPNFSAEIRCGKVKFRVNGMPGEDFPPLPNPGPADYVDLDALAVGTLISQTQYSMSTDDTRPHLAGALFEGEARSLRMVTTDGHRLSKSEFHLPDTSNELSFSMLIPNKGIGELRKLIDDIKSNKNADPVIGVTTTAGSAFFRAGDVQLNVKLAEEQFPPYAKVIPQHQTRRVICDRQSLISCLKRISLVANDKSGIVRVMVEEGLIRIVGESPEVGEGSEEIDVDYAGDPVAIGFNARYLLDALNCLNEDEIALELSGELDPGVVRPVSDTTDFVGVVMPMRI